MCVYARVRLTSGQNGTDLGYGAVVVWQWYLVRWMFGAVFLANGWAWRNTEAYNGTQRWER